MPSKREENSTLFWNISVVCLVLITYKWANSKMTCFVKYSEFNDAFTLVTYNVAQK